MLITRGRFDVITLFLINLNKKLNTPLVYKKIV